MILRLGSRGSDVRDLQLKLKALGYYRGDVDGDYGPITAAAVLAFQLEYESLVDDSEAGPLTRAKLDQALAIREFGATKPVEVRVAFTPTPCADEDWRAMTELVDLLTDAKNPARYGPGRGLFDGKTGTWIVTNGPGALKSNAWKSALGRPFPSFHCTSLLNFVLGRLLRFNANYTHAGNIPSAFDLLEQSNFVHQNPGAGPWRGYGDSCSPIEPDGSAVKRHGQSKIMDMREILARRESLPTFVPFAQSSHTPAGIKWWHHVGMVMIDHRDGHRTYRLAADGYFGASGWSGLPIQFAEVTDKTVQRWDGAFYKCWGVDERADGTYGDRSKPIAPVVFES